VNYCRPTPPTRRLDSPATVTCGQSRRCATSRGQSRSAPAVPRPTNVWVPHCWPKAIEQGRAAIRLQPDIATAHNNLAWFLTNAPDPQHRQPAEALEQARKAVEMAPKEGNNYNTLALAEYHTVHWSESLAAREQSMKLRKGGDAYDWFLLALAFWQQAEKDRAWTWFDKAVTWVKEQPRKDADLFQLWGTSWRRWGRRVTPRALATTWWTRRPA
jgi:tetratricopeptide (TPR) repeat protein